MSDPVSLLVVGGGGREHALVWSLLKSDQCNKILWTPGNKAVVKDQKKVECLPALTNAQIVEKAKEEKVSWVVVGPEIPLAEGLADDLENAGILCFGPKQQAARIESSKAFSKDFMVRHDIPTADYKTFTDVSEALAYVDSVGPNIVIKASGLAAGKGVILPSTVEEAKAAVEDIMVQKAFGGAGDSVVIEELLEGPEASFLVFTDGTRFASMPPAQDHKRVGDGDQGPNTGGMGVIAPSPTVTPEIMREVQEKIIAPAIKGMREEGYPFVGVLYAGVMLTPKGPKTLEYNCRFGDPETQVLLPLLKSDLVAVMRACVTGTLDPELVEFHSGKVATSVVAASGGYPGSYPKGKTIYGISEAESYPEVTVFHSGTTLSSSQTVETSGGRVLCVTALGPDFSTSLRRSYGAMNRICFEGMQYRKDIGAKVLPPVRIAVLGSTRGTDMQAIIDAIKEKKIHAEITMVVSNQKNAYILERAKEHAIPFCYLPCKKGQTRESWDSVAIQLIESGGPVDVVMLIGFMRILSPVFVNHFKNKLINVHPSLLPEFAGGMDMNVHEEVIKSGKEVTGCTVHFVTEEVDAGEIILQKKCNVTKDETPDTLKAKVQALEGECLVEIVRKVQRRDLHPQSSVSVTYKDAGVDIEAGDDLVDRIKPFCKATSRPGSDAVIGGFGGIFDLKAAGFVDPLLVSGTDGVGTKLEIARMAGIHNTVGIDLVAMCVNDILVQGAEPLFFLDYFATGKLDVGEAAQVVQGIAHACKESGCALLGGETAEMPGMYKPGDYDIAGFAVGAVDRNLLIPREPTEIADGDVLIALLSSGFHSNGFSLVRHLLATNHISPHSPPQWVQKDNKHKRICDALLEPTRLYVKALVPILKKGLIKAAAHITGGGILGNLPRVLGGLDENETDLRFEVDMSTWDIPEMIKYFIKLGNLKVSEAVTTWNCGLGMILVVGKDQAEKVLGELREIQEEAIVIGKVFTSQTEKEFVKLLNTENVVN
eukprot:TRINITY_DN4050_c0_g1_i1.p1 TRINITY_DN4050_c0_g1~~TRINITY_DN4050_c0_g1_i1.p1  ORF type:complete len:993 (+),score=204.87 TRINITY_DN4050_c0_g1_i1:15-2993(+)